MPDREKAIRILEGNYKNFVLRHNGELLTVNELIALLKAQEPHVLTLEEYKAWMDIPFQERDPIFHEMKLRRGSVTGWTNTADCCVENYGKTARCWTSRPTDEQMEAVKWDD